MKLYICLESFVVCLNGAGCPGSKSCMQLEIERLAKMSWRAKNDNHGLCTHRNEVYVCVYRFESGVKWYRIRVFT